MVTSHNFGQIRDEINSDPTCFDAASTEDGEYDNCGSGSPTQLTDDAGSFLSAYLSFPVTASSTYLVDYDGLTPGNKGDRCLCFKKDDGGLACTNVYQSTIVDCVTNRADVTVSNGGWIVLDANVPREINYADIKSQFNIDPSCFAASPDAKHGHYSNCEAATPTMRNLASLNSDGETIISYPTTTDEGVSTTKQCICFGGTNDDLICSKMFLLRNCHFSSLSPDPIFISTSNGVMSHDFADIKTTISSDADCFATDTV